MSTVKIPYKKVETNSTINFDTNSEQREKAHQILLDKIKVTEDNVKESMLCNKRIT